MNNFEFEYPYFFILLVLILCIYRCPVVFKKIIFPHIHLFTKTTNWINTQRVIYSIILTLMVSALASPITYAQKSSDNRKGRDLVFALDTSGSMAESGFDKEDKKKRKFDILKAVLSEFISNRFDDNVGVSIFGSYAYPAIALTYDMNSVKYLLNFFDVGIAGESTAIGEAIESSLRVLKKSKAKKKVIILVTDGYQNSGTISIREAVNRAKEMKVKIYTIGIGRDFDKKLLKRISKETDAKMFSAKDKEALQEVYDALNELEPSKIKSQHIIDKNLLYYYPLLSALLLLMYILYRQRKELL